jgi:ribosomal protein S18 acetylase RimI-like enzyme
LYVQRDRQSHGFGQQLMNVMIPWLEEQYPTRPIWLTVWSGNVKAQKFYTHYGFSKVGEFDYSVGELKNCEFIMKRETNTDSVFLIKIKTKNPFLDDN